MAPDRIIVFAGGRTDSKKKSFNMKIELRKLIGIQKENKKIMIMNSTISHKSRDSIRIDRKYDNPS